MPDLEMELKQLIVEALDLEDIDPGSIESDEPLFNGGLGLDSIDALELGVAIRQRYGIKLDSVSDEIKIHFASVRNLALFIQAQRKDQ